METISRRGSFSQPVLCRPYHTISFLISDERLIFVVIDRQEDEAEVRCDGHVLKNVLKFEYLGSIFSASGDR